MEKWSEFFVSICIISLVFTSSSFILTSTIGKEEALTSTRYSFVYEAIDHINDDNTLSVVGIGSSMMEQAFDGNCMTNNSNNNIAFYNLGMPASRSYTDMMMIPRLSASSVDLVMIEVGVNLLFMMDYEKENVREDPDNYVEMRLRIGTMMQEEQDIGGWVNIILPEHKAWLDINSIQRAEDLQYYTQIGLENHLRTSVSNVYDIGLTPKKIPSLGSERYDDYLRTPTGSWANTGIDFMTKEELNQYNESLKSGSSYRPLANGTANHEALFYEVETLLAAGKQVVIVTLPHYKDVYKHLDEGQWDGFNETLRDLGEYDVSFLNYTFDMSWQYSHFRDHNHLDSDGRKEFCRRVAPEIEQLLVR
jgi:hypothetical protein